MNSASLDRARPVSHRWRGAPCRSLGAGARQGPLRRSRARSLVTRKFGSAYRFRAAKRRAFHGHDRREHRPVWYDTQCRSDHRGCQVRRRTRSYFVVARWLRDGNRRGWHRIFLRASAKGLHLLARFMETPFLWFSMSRIRNLDHDGEAALTSAILGVRSRGGVVVVVAHRPSALAALDKVLVLGNGRQQAFGPKDEVLRAVTRSTAPLKVVTQAGVAAS